MRMVNIGCGPYKIDGFINIDINPLQNPDMIRDVRRGLPFDTSSVDKLVASHILEHLDPDNFIWVMGEIYRVLISDGVLQIEVPLGITGSVDHKMFFTKDSFDMFFRPEASLYYQTDFRWEFIDQKESICASAGTPLLNISMRAIK